VVRHSLTGAPGVLCLLEAERVRAFWDALTRQGKAVGLQAVGWEALQIARIEGGRPWFGLDMDQTTLLPETGLEKILASDTKGCYIGQEIVARMQTYGSASKKLTGLRLSGTVVPQPKDRLWRDQEEVGWVTSACFSPALGHPIALGYVKRPRYEPGTAVTVECDGQRLPATIVTPPFLSTNKGSDPFPALGGV
jgi:aminomethyltransferase